MVLSDIDKEIGIDENQIADAGAEALASALPHSHSLRHLYVGQNALSSAGEEILRAAKPAHMSIHLHR